MTGKRRDYYEVLGVQRGAKSDEIKKAYRKAALKWHPDRFKTENEKKGAEERFKEIGEAYAVLSDPQKKQMYDQFGHAAFDPRAGAGPGGVRFTGFDFGDASKIFEEFFGGNFSSIFGGGPGRRSTRGGRSGFGADSSDFSNFGNIFGEGFQGAGNSFQSPQQPPKGQDVRISLMISFEESMRGAEKKIRLSSGSTSGKTLKVRIPVGVPDGTKLRIPKQGKPGPAGAPPGDLVAEVHVEPHPLFRRDDSNLIYEAPISLGMALLGGEIEVPTWDGNQAKIRVPAGIQPGTRLRLAGKGVPGSNGSSSGDLVVKVQVQLPRTLNKRQKEIIAEFEAIEKLKD
ncbi:MAG: DnaJ C-terminal domain-containing protein [Candidatus Hodarchaeales archaeon]|jgi:DnaJ-class molecular chaperone